MDEVKLSVPAIEKLLDYTASGVGAVAGPMLANWGAQREGKARLTAARYNAEIRRIEAKSHADSLHIIAEAQTRARASLEESTESSRSTLELSHGDITQSIEFQSRKRLANVRSVVEDAAEELGEEKVADHEPDHDWTARFFDFAQDVTSEDMRKIWARILAGEVRRPGETSMRTLETLRNMTKKDAEIFREFCDFVIECDFAFYDKPTQEYEPLSFERLLHLQECGLISAEIKLRKEITWNKSGLIVFGYKKGLLVLRKTRKNDGKLTFPIIGLTSVGKELSTLVEPTMRMGYLQVFAKYLQNMGCELDYVEGVAQMPNGQISYTKQTRIQPYAGE